MPFQIVSSQSGGPSLTLVDSIFSLGSGDWSGMFFSSDGTKLYTLNEDTDTVYQYTIADAWDISSAILPAVNTFVDGGASDWITPRAIHFKDDGSKLYVTGESPDFVYQYPLNTAWDLSTAQLKESSFVTNPPAGSVTGLTFKPDGSEMYVVDRSSGGDSVFQYNLPTPWEVSSASTSTLFDTNPPHDNATDVQFSTDGTTMYVVGYDNDRIYQYTLSIPWDVTSSSVADINESFYVGSQESTPRSMYFRTDGLTMFLVGSGSDTVRTYTLSVAWDITTAVHGVWV